MNEYKVSQTSYRTWEVEKDDGTTYFVRLQVKEASNGTSPYAVFLCSCIWAVNTGKPCRHVRLVQKYIKNGKGEINESKV